MRKYPKIPGLTLMWAHHILVRNVRVRHAPTGIGIRLKNLMGERMDAWLEEPGHLERWTKGPKEGGLHAWEKRALITQLAGQAWEEQRSEADRWLLQKAR